MKCVSNICVQISNCQPLEVVGRSSETQLQVNENLNRFEAIVQGLLLFHTDTALLVHY